MGGDALGWVAHGLCLAPLAGRVLHADGVSQANEVCKFRVAGMVRTFSVFVVGAVGIVLT